jgi:hypothetical protein
MPKVIMMRGPSGSGKSTWAKNYVTENKKVVRINRDDLRAMLHQNKHQSHDYEDVVGKAETQIAHAAISKGFDVIVDNTHLTPRSEARWENFCKGYPSLNFQTKDMGWDLEKCVHNDFLRGPIGGTVGEAVIHRQFLEAGKLVLPEDRKIVLVDVDGTLADHEGIRSAYDESKVLSDRPRETIIKWVQALAEEYTIIIVSGRHSTCGSSTSSWLTCFKVPFKYLFMRHAWSNQSDVLEKNQILTALLKLVPKERIAFALDDRQKVINGVWRVNGITVYPVRGEGPETDF